MATEGTMFDGIRQGLTEALEALRNGQPLTCREVEFADPPTPLAPEEIAATRRHVLRVSQAVFARLLNVAVQTVQAWEQGRTAPSGAALRLLHVVKAHPAIFTQMLSARRLTSAPPDSRVRAKPRRQSVAV